MSDKRRAVLEEKISELEAEQALDRVIEERYQKLEKLEINTATDKKWGIICSLTQTPMNAKVKWLRGR